MAHYPQNQWHETLEYAKTNNTFEFTHVLQWLQAAPNKSTPFCKKDDVSTQCFSWSKKPPS
jgi:hypothetical protein